MIAVAPGGHENAELDVLLLILVGYIIHNDSKMATYYYFFLARLTDGRDNRCDLLLTIMYAARLGLISVE